MGRGRGISLLSLVYVGVGVAIAASHNYFDNVVVTDTVPIDPLTKPERVTVITVADILAETIHNVFADDSVSAIFGDMNALF